MPYRREDFAYDPETDTVRVSRRALTRLLLQFRQDREDAGGMTSREDPWLHMQDYDHSFEYLADAVDSGLRKGEEPDLRLRCKRTAAYEWPGSLPYREGTPPQAVTVAGGYGSHLQVPDPYARSDDSRKALCGLAFMSSEARKTNGPAECSVCVREWSLMCQIPHQDAPNSPAPTG